MRAIARSRLDVGTLASWNIGLAVTKPQAPTLNGTAQDGTDLYEAVRDYVRTYAVLHGKPKAAEALGVLQRLCAAAHALQHRAGDGPPRVAAIEEAPQGVAGDAEERLILQAQARRRLKDGGASANSATGSKRLSETLEDALRLLCAAPFDACVREFVTVNRMPQLANVPTSHLERRIARM